MDSLWIEALRSQFLAAIDMLEKPITACPDELWHSHLWPDPFMNGAFTQFWYVAYHCLFWLDLYLSGTEAGFQPPPPFDLNELDPQGLLPANKITRNDLLVYLAYCRQKCLTTIEQLSDEAARRPCEFPWSYGKISFAELQLDNMRHVQEHSAQLNMFLGQHATISSRWVGRSRTDPHPPAPSA